ncbi:MAG: GYD domain-containing protein [Acidimicrobiales bacterium]
MARYLLHGRYDAQMTQGLLAGGAASRRDAVQALAASVGGSVIDEIRWAFGGTESYVLMELPDDEAAHAIVLTVTSVPGTSWADAIKLLDADSVDRAIAKSAAFRPPGS